MTPGRPPCSRMRCSRLCVTHAPYQQMPRASAQPINVTATDMNSAGNSCGSRQGDRVTQRKLCPGLHRLSNVHQGSTLGVQGSQKHVEGGTSAVIASKPPADHPQFAERHWRPRSKASRKVVPGRGWVGVMGAWNFFFFFFAWCWKGCEPARDHNSIYIHD